MTTSGVLDGRVALVTGGAGFIGRDIAARLRDHGAIAVAADIDPAVHRDPPEHSDGVVPWQFDITDPREVAAAVDAIHREVGPIDIVVNAAGVFGDFTRTDRITVDTWNRYLQVNLSGHFYVTRHVLGSMAERRWGRIVNIASISSTEGGYRQAHYASAKAGLIGLTRSVALEFASRNVTCNAVLPGPIETPAVLAAAPGPVLDDSLEWIPAARFGTTAEVAGLVAFLAGPDASYINGAAIPVDGAALLLQFRFARRSSATRVKEGPK